MVGQFCSSYECEAAKPHFGGRLFCTLAPCFICELLEGLSDDGAWTTKPSPSKLARYWLLQVSRFPIHTTTFVVCCTLSTSSYTSAPTSHRPPPRHLPGPGNINRPPSITPTSDSRCCSTPLGCVPDLLPFLCSLHCTQCPVNPLKMDPGKVGVCIFDQSTPAVRVCCRLGKPFQGASPPVLAVNLPWLGSGWPSPSLSYTLGETRTSLRLDIRVSVSRWCCCVLFL